MPFTRGRSRYTHVSLCRHMGPFVLMIKRLWMTMSLSMGYTIAHSRTLLSAVCPLTMYALLKQWPAEQSRTKMVVLAK